MLHAWRHLERCTQKGVIDVGYYCGKATEAPGWMEESLSVNIPSLRFELLTVCI